MTAHEDSPGVGGSDELRSRAEALYAEFLRRRAAGDDVEFDAFCSGHAKDDTALRILHLACGEDEPEGDRD